MTQKMVSNFHGTDIIYNHAIVENPIEKHFGLHTHDICEVIFLKSGDVSAVIGGKTYKLSKNSITIFRPGIIHAIKIDNEKTIYERYNILFDEKKIANKIFDKIPKELEVINYSGNNFITDIFKKMDYYHEHFENENLRILIHALVEELIFNLSLTPTREMSGAPVSVNPLISQAIEFIEKNFEKDISVEDVSRALYISKRHLHHLFCENLQISPKKYINSIRLAKAQNLLRIGAKPSSVYDICGFSDYATFYRNYINHFGHSPSMETVTEIERKIRS